MLIGERVLGVISVQAYRPHAWDEEDELLLSTIADQVALALEKARLFQERERRVTELAIVNEIGQAVSSTLEIDDLLETVHQQVNRLFDTTNFFIATYEEKNNEWIIAFHVEHGQPQPTGQRHKVDVGLTGDIIRNRQHLFFQSGEEILAFHKSRGIDPIGPMANSWLGVPLIAENELVGMLSIMSQRARAFDEPTLELLTTIGTQVGKVVNTARLYEELEAAQRSAESWSKELEQKVSERTVELNDAREELESLNEDLEQRVGKRTQELDDMQTKIVQSGRLAAVGELAAGVAHELNNPLGGILGYAQYDLEKLKGAESLSGTTLEKVVEHLTFIESGAQRCAEIVESLLRFSETSRCASTDVNVNELVEETLGFTSREFANRGIELKIDLEEGGLEVVGDPRQLQQVFTNIVMNARKAMTSGGRLSVASARIPHENGGADSVAISFGDTGCGIPEKDLVRVFEPFFSTGEVGEGSGLGLSVSYGIVKDHGGNIDVESKVGVGSTFTVLLPLAGSDGSENPLEGRA